MSTNEPSTPNWRSGATGSQEGPGERYDTGYPRSKDLNTRCLYRFNMFFVLISAIMQVDNRLCVLASLAKIT